MSDNPKKLFHGFFKSPQKLVSFVNTYSEIIDVVSIASSSAKQYDAVLYYMCTIKDAFEYFEQIPLEHKMMKRRTDDGGYIQDGVIE